MTQETLPVEPVLVSPGTAESLGAFAEYRRIGTTQISTFTVPPGSVFEMPAGPRVEDEESRVAFDVAGEVYPIRESVFQASYAPVAEADEQRLAPYAGQPGYVSIDLQWDVDPEGTIAHRRVSWPAVPREGEDVLLGEPGPLMRVDLVVWQEDGSVVVKLDG